VECFYGNLFRFRAFAEQETTQGQHAGTPGHVELFDLLFKMHKKHCPQADGKPARTVKLGLTRNELMKLREKRTES
jgi:hypothetical protein